MIYYIIINTQHINKFFSESTCQLLFQYYSTVDHSMLTFPNLYPPSCISLILQYSRWEQYHFQSVFSF